MIAALLAAGLTSATVPAFAQSTNPPTAKPQVRHAGPGHHAKRAHQLPSQREEARLAYIQTALKITDAQKPQWENFASTMRKQAHEADKRVQERRTRMADRANQKQTGAIERLERRQQMMAAGAQRLNELIAAGKPLYTVFTPEQKQIADGLLAERNGRGGHKHHRGAHRNA